MASKARPKKSRRDTDEEDLSRTNAKIEDIRTEFASTGAFGEWFGEVLADRLHEQAQKVCLVEKPPTEIFSPKNVNPEELAAIFNADPIGETPQAMSFLANYSLGKKAIFINGGYTGECERGARHTAVSFLLTCKMFYFLQVKGSQLILRLDMSGPNALGAWIYDVVDFVEDVVWILKYGNLPCIAEQMDDTNSRSDQLSILGIQVFPMSFSIGETGSSSVTTLSCLSCGALPACIPMSTSIPTFLVQAKEGTFEIAIRRGASIYIDGVQEIEFGIDSNIPGSDADPIPGVCDPNFDAAAQKKAMEMIETVKRLTPKESPMKYGELQFDDALWRSIMAPKPNQLTKTDTDISAFRKFLRKKSTRSAGFHYGNKFREFVSSLESAEEFYQMFLCFGIDNEKSRELTTQGTASAICQSLTSWLIKGNGLGLGLIVSFYFWKSDKMALLIEHLQKWDIPEDLLPQSNQEFECLRLCRLQLLAHRVDRPKCAPWTKEEHTTFVEKLRPLHAQDKLLPWKLCALYGVGSKTFGAPPMYTFSRRLVRFPFLNLYGGSYYACHRAARQLSLANVPYTDAMAAIESVSDLKARWANFVLEFLIKARALYPRSFDENETREEVKAIREKKAAAARAWEGKRKEEMVDGKEQGGENAGSPKLDIDSPSTGYSDIAKA